MTQDPIDDAAWTLIVPFLTPVRGRTCRPSLDNRRVLEGMFSPKVLWIGLA
jgi:transposase